MKAGHLAAIAVSLLCTGCAGVGIAVTALGGITMGSLATTGKGPIDETMSVASGQDCSILDGLSHPDRGICEPHPTVAVAGNAAPGPQKVESKVEPAPAVATASLKPQAMEASLLADHCAVATVPSTPCREAGSTVQVASAAHTPAPSAASVTAAKEPAQPVRVAAREPKHREKPATRSVAMKEPATRSVAMKEKSATRSLAMKEPPRAVAANDKKPPEPARESVAWVADDSVKVGLGPNGSTEAFRKQLHAALERWQQAQAQ